MEENAQLVKRFMEEMVPFNQFLELQIDEFREGFCRLRVPWRAELLGDPLRQATHGGVVATLLDVAGGAASMSCLDMSRHRLSTLNLRVDYLRPGPPKEMVCEAIVEHLGNKACIVSMKLFSAEDDREQVGPIAMGQGIYSIAQPSSAAREKKDDPFSG
jgi:uncharacterized protein (TIGR00369 family)